MLPEDIKIIMGNVLFVVFSMFIFCFAKASAHHDFFESFENPPQIIEIIIK